MNESLQAKLGQMKRVYVEQLKKTLPVELAKYQQTNGALTESDALNELSRYLHKLAGSGGSFGLPQITTLSKAAEHVANEIAADAKTENQDKKQQLQRLLDDLQSHVQALTENSGATKLASLAPGSAQAHSDKDNSKPPTLWLLDDDHHLLNGLYEQMVSFGFDVRIFSQFVDFKSALHASEPDFIIADVNLDNGLDFYQAAEHYSIKLHSAGLIMLSSFDDFSARIKAVRAGAVAYLQKPVDSTRLANLVREQHLGSEFKPERVLLIDDDTELAELYKAQLEAAGMQVVNLTDPTKVITAIQEHQPELVLIDLYMPEYNGMELAALIRQFDAFASMPIVYLSSEADTLRQSEALEKGADDFLTKPISARSLVAALRQRVRRARQLQALISKDSLTGLLKHSSIKDALSNELSRAFRNKEPLCASMLDIDHFKRVNDNYGHAVGDTVIASLATLLTQRLRQSDHIGRYGGEEFMLVMPACRQDAAQKILDDIRERFEAIQFVAGSEVFNCTLSAGYLVVQPDDEKSPSTESIIERADAALYVSKNNGRNQVTPAEGH